jgi:hypothetical protein
MPIGPPLAAPNFKLEPAAAWIKDYNSERPHQGRWCFGKTMNKVQRDDFGPLEGDAEPSDKHNYEFVVMS